MQFAPLLVLALLLPSFAAGVEPSRACVPHPSISIVGDVGPTGFVLGFAPATGTPIYRPGSGVTAGAGTAEDPFVIQGLCLGAGSARTPLSRPPPALHLEGTSLHVIVRDVSLATSGPTEPGIRLLEASNVTLGSSDLGSALPLLEMEDVAHVVVQDNLFRNSPLAVEIVRSRDVVFRDNEFALDDSPLGDTAVWGLRVDDATFERNAITAGYGLSLSTCARVRVEDNTFTRTDRALDLTQCGGVVSGNAIDGGGDRVVRLSNGQGLLVEDNRITGTGWGILVDSSSGDTLRGNEVPRIRLLKSTEVTLQANALAAGGLDIAADNLAQWLHTIPPDNTEAGVPIRYHRGLRDATLDGGAGTILLAGASNVVVSRQTFADVPRGVVVAHSEDVVVKDSTFTNVSRGVWFRGSKGGAIEGNAFDGSSTSMYLDGSTRVRVEANAVDGSGEDCTGLRIYGSSLSTVVGNDISACGVGIDVGPSARNNTIRANTLRDHQKYGIRSLGGGWGNHGTTIEANDITGNLRGVRIETVPLRVVENNLWGNALDAVEYAAPLAGESVDARGNWWGCDGGPGEHGCDTAGSGVAYEPWLGAPNAAAGAR